jgi:hypothetical protein
VHESVELPEPVTLVGDKVQAVLLLLRATAPVKPFNAVIVIELVPAVFTFTDTLVGLAPMLKS